MATLDFTDLVKIRKGLDEPIPYGCTMIYGKLKTGDDHDNHHGKKNGFCYIGPS